MITLAAFGPAFGLSDPSPFVMKVEILLKMAGQSYNKDTSMGAFRRAPKGKVPYIVDDGLAVADSTFIRFHLERKYAVDFDQGLSAQQRATGWAFEKLAEDHLYWAMVYSRWLDEANIPLIKSHLLSIMPPVIGPLLFTKARRDIRSYLKAQGLGRNSAEEIYDLGRRDVFAISDALGERPFFFGSEPKAVDAALGAFVAGILCEAFTSPLREAAERRDNLVAYRNRIVERFFQVPRTDRVAA
jgi:glutathione S-transferase